MLYMQVGIEFFKPQYHGTGVIDGSNDDSSDDQIIGWLGSERQQFGFNPHRTTLLHHHFNDGVIVTTQTMHSSPEGRFDNHQHHHG